MNKTVKKSNEAPIIKPTRIPVSLWKNGFGFKGNFILERKKYQIDLYINKFSGNRTPELVGHIKEVKLK